MKKMYLSIAAVGDIMMGELPVRLGNGVGSQIKRAGPECLFQHVRGLLKENDIVFGNLETVISTHEHKPWSVISSQLRAHPMSINGLIYAGFNVLNLSNNHTLDHGSRAYSETVEILSQNNILVLSNDTEALIQQINGLTVAFISSSDVSSRAYQVPQDWEQMLLKSTSEASKQAEIVIISLHWGYEYVPYPSPQQILLARQLIDHGANLILGHHPHIVQGLERYKHGLIFYSLGNFIFDHWQERLREGILIRCKLFPDRVENVEVIPVFSDDNFIVHVMDDVNKGFFLAKYETMSTQIAEEDLSNYQTKCEIYLKEAETCRAEFRKELREYFKNNYYKLPLHISIQLASKGLLNTINNKSDWK